MEDEAALQTLVSNSHPETLVISSGHSVIKEGGKMGMMKNTWTRVFLTNYLLGLIGKSPGVLGERCVFMGRCQPQCSSPKAKFRILIMDSVA